jgi:hypothetical protein
MPARRQRTLIFCTAYAEDLGTWERRYRTWIRAVRSSGVSHEQLLIVDDGSPVLPRWADTTTVYEGERAPQDAAVVLAHFNARLGRSGLRDYPGWFRSFCFAAQYAKEQQFTKVVHLESDAFIISTRFATFVNEASEGWIGLKLPRHKMPESAIQIIAGKNLDQFVEFSKRSYEEFRGKNIENHIPYSVVVDNFKGDRYGQFLPEVPRDADWSVQVYPPARNDPKYFWWIEPDSRRAQVLEAAMHEVSYLRKVDPKKGHEGIHYTKFVPFMIDGLDATSFFQLGPGLGKGTSDVTADVLWVSAALGGASSITIHRNRTTVLKMSPKFFFAHQDLRAYFPLGPDVAFLDGDHHIEVLLNEFVRTERACHSGSLILVHDCLPLNDRMAERSFRLVQAEGAATRDFWTGDVWKLVPILKCLRPEMKLFYIDCPPTGLLVCAQLDPLSNALEADSSELVQSLSSVSLSEFGVVRLWSLCPTLDSSRLFRNPAGLREALALQ